MQQLASQELPRRRRSSRSIGTGGKGKERLKPCENAEVQATIASPVAATKPMVLGPGETLAVLVLRAHSPLTAHKLPTDS
jgi:hypothetical protein